MNRGKPDPHALRRVREMCDRAGVRLAEMQRTGSNHYLALVEAPDGRRTKIVLASTASDWKAGINMLTMMRRFARGAPT